MIDNGRFETTDSATGCTTSGSYQSSETFTLSPPETGHLVLRNAERGTGRTRCGDRTVDATCLFHSTTMVRVLPGEIRMVSRLIRSDCNPPA
jgi:hypothetical protein